MTPLDEEIRRLIRAHGPMSVADYMSLCLSHYYMTRDPFGRGGDFTTAPEITQIFGELLGLWAAETWRRMGEPSPVRLVELGPGRGTLMSDALRALKIVPGFLEAARLHLVEISPVLREIQARALAGHQPVWHEKMEDVPPGPTILLANEFFDALPIRQFVRTETEWLERVVGFNGDHIIFGLSASLAASSVGLLLPACGEKVGMRGAGPDARRLNQANPTSALATDFPYEDLVAYNPAPLIPSFSPQAGRRSPSELAARTSPSSMIWEVSPASETIARTIADRLAAEGGAALIIDYGHIRSGFGDTLQAVRGHAFADPLAEPGQADLTAHVDFEALGRAAKLNGAMTFGPVPQGEFLSRLGIEARAARLKARATPAQAENIDFGVARLIGPDAMGVLFKVMAIAAPGLAPPGFD